MKILHATLLASLLAASHGLMAQPTASSTTTVTAPGAAATVRTLQSTSTVVAIVPETRTIRLKRADGQVVEVQAGEEVRNFNKIKVGDTVKTDYTEALSLELKKGGSGAADATETTDMTRAPVGAQPSGAVGRQVSVLADVVAVNSKDQVVTLRGPQGDVVDLKVRDPEQLKRIKKGDQVRAVYSEALAIAVEPASASAVSGK